MISQTVVECVAIREKVHHGLSYSTVGVPNRRKAMLIHTDIATIRGYCTESASSLSLIRDAFLVLYAARLLLVLVDSAETAQ